MNAPTIQVAEDVLAVLSRAETDGTALRLVGQLERRLYVRVNDVLAAAGGKWNRRAKAHLFDGDAAEAMEQIMATGQITCPQDMGQFDSPPEVVARLITLARIAPGMTVLEPSAGIGNIVAGLRDTGASVEAVEIDAKRCERLERDLFPGNVGLTCGDFLGVAPSPTFDRVVMNPPFAKQADIDHVRHALAFVRPGGRLVSVMASGITFRENRKTIEMRDLIDARGGSIEPLPEGSFRSSGTLVNAVIVTLTAEGADA
jgi:protein-L-isoaspartate O-methyltransferase